MDFTRDELNMVYQFGADTKADTLKELQQIQPYLGDRKLKDIVDSTLQKLSSMSETECQKFILEIRQQFIAERDRSIEEWQRAARQGHTSAGRQKRKTIGDLLEEARRKSGAEKLAGHDIMDLMRFADDTRHMVVFDVLSDESTIGFIVMNRKHEVPMRTITDMSEIQTQYKIIRNALVAERDLETLLLVRILMETGIRSVDACDIEPINIRDRTVIVRSKKQSDFYREYNGKYPCISRRTEQIAEALLQKQGMYFTKDRRDYIMKIRKILPEAHFSLHEFRHFHILCQCSLEI